MPSGWPRVASLHVCSMCCTQEDQYAKWMAACRLASCVFYVLYPGGPVCQVDGSVSPRFMCVLCIIPRRTSTPSGWLRVASLHVCSMCCTQEDQYAKWMAACRLASCVFYVLYPGGPVCQVDGRVSPRFMCVLCIIPRRTSTPSGWLRVASLHVCSMCCTQEDQYAKWMAACRLASCVFYVLYPGGPVRQVDGSVSPRFMCVLCVVPRRTSMPSGWQRVASLHVCSMCCTQEDQYAKWMAACRLASCVFYVLYPGGPVCQVDGCVSPRFMCVLCVVPRRTSTPSGWLRVASLHVCSMCCTQEDQYAKWMAACRLASCVFYVLYPGGPVRQVDGCVLPRFMCVLFIIPRRTSMPSGWLRVASPPRVRRWRTVPMTWR